MAENGLVGFGNTGKNSLKTLVLTPWFGLFGFGVFLLFGFLIPGKLCNIGGLYNLLSVGFGSTFLLLEVAWG